MALYLVRPLKWRHVRDDCWTADTVLGSINVELDGDCYVWQFCFDEFYDEGRYAVSSVAEGKREAEAFYLRRLLPALDPVEAEEKS